MQDPILKRIFAIPGKIELLAWRCRPDPASTVDFATLAELPLRNLVYTGLAAQKLLKRFRDRGESVELAVVSMVLYHGADPWRAPATVEELVPGVTRYTLVRPEAVGPGAASAEDIPVLVLGLLVPGQTPIEQRRRLDALKRALRLAADPRLRTPWSAAVARVRPLAG